MTTTVPPRSTRRGSHPDPEAPPVMTLRQPAARPSEVFAEQMRIQRERKGWTQKQLAARLGKLGYVVHQTTVGKWETGERRITIDEALVISVALDVSPAYMFAGSYLDGTFSSPSIALSAKTPPVSARTSHVDGGARIASPTRPADDPSSRASAAAANANR